jgi:hypothetical protein
VGSPLVGIEHSVEEIFVLKAVVPKDVLEQVHLLEGLAELDRILSTGGCPALDEIIHRIAANKYLFVCFETKFSVLEFDVFLEFIGNFVEILMEFQDAWPHGDRISVFLFLNDGERCCFFMLFNL